MLLRESVQQGQKVSQLVVPEKFQTDMFRAYHDDLGHQGRAQSMSLMKRRLVWPGMEAFVSQKIKECGLTGMKKTCTTPYHPLGNGMVERFNRTLLNMLGTLERGLEVPCLNHDPCI